MYIICLLLYSIIFYVFSCIFKKVSILQSSETVFPSIFVLQNVSSVYHFKIYTNTSGKCSYLAMHEQAEG